MCVCQLSKIECNKNICVTEMEKRKKEILLVVFSEMMSEQAGSSREFFGR